MSFDISKTDLNWKLLRLVKPSTALGCFIRKSVRDADTLSNLPGYLQHWKCSSRRCNSLMSFDETGSFLGGVTMG